MQWDKKMFVSGLQALAVKTKYTLTEWDIDAYLEELEQYPYEKALLAMKSFFKNGTNKFPEIKDFKKAMGVAVQSQLEPIEEAKLIAQRIEGSIRSHGYTNPDKAEANIGPIGWKIIQLRGGWTSLCESVTEDNLSYVLHEIIGSVAAYIKNPDSAESVNLKTLGDGKLKEILELTAPRLKLDGPKKNDA
jgi:hypothetical protein